MPQGRDAGNIKALIIYWSATGNTEKVAHTIRDTLVREGIAPVVKKVAEAADDELYDYDLVFLGAPSYSFQPPDQVQRYIKDKMKLHSGRGDIKPGSPRIPGKTAVVFCTYSGPHTGIREATPAGDYMGQFFEHLGFDVAAKWYLVGEFHGREDMSTQGRLGDIRGRPNREDLDNVAGLTAALLKSIREHKKN
ncbi:MAG: flavodoxin domain-containing protein [Dehalococcoidales bacterium]|jgi:flavorubredoxin